MTWYKRVLTRCCFRPYMEQTISLVYEEPDVYEWDEGKRSPTELALFAHPAYRQGYPIWSSWSDGKEIPLSQEEAQDFLENQKSEAFWKNDKIWLAEKLKEIISETGNVILALLEQKGALLDYKDRITQIPCEEKILSYHTTICNSFKSFEKEIEKKIAEEELKRNQAKELHERFFGFVCSPEEQCLIDEYWWYASEYPKDKEYRRETLDELREKYRIIRASVEGCEKKGECWIRIQ